MADIQKLITLTQKNDAGPYFDAFYSADCLTYTQSVDGNNIYLASVGSTAVITVPDTTDCIKLVSVSGPCDNFVISGSNAPTTTTTTTSTLPTTTTSTTTTAAPTTTTTTSTTVLARYWNSTYCDGSGAGPTVQDSTALLESGAVVKFAGGGEEFCVTLTTENFAPFIWFPIVTGDFGTCIACLPATTTTTTSTTLPTTTTTTSTTLPTTTTTTSTTILSGNCRFVFVPDTQSTTDRGLRYNYGGEVNTPFSSLFGTPTNIGGEDGVVYTVCSTNAPQWLIVSTNTTTAFPSGVILLADGGVCFGNEECEYVPPTTTTTTSTTLPTTTTTTSTSIAPTTTTTTSTTAQVCNCITVDVLNTQLTDGGLDLYYIVNDCGGGSRDINLAETIGTEVGNSTYFGICSRGTTSNLFKYGPSGDPFVGLPGMNINPNGTVCNVDGDCAPVTPTTTTTTSTSIAPTTTTTTSTSIAPTTTTTTSTTVASCNCITVDVLNTQLTNGGLDLYYIVNDCSGGARDINLAETIGTEQGGSTYFGICSSGTTSNLFKYGPSGSPFVGIEGMNINPNGTICTVDGDCLPVVPTTTTTTSTSIAPTTTTSTTTSTTLAPGTLWNLFCPSSAGGGCAYTFTKLDGTLCSDTIPPDTDTIFCVKETTTPSVTGGVWTELGDPCTFDSCLEYPI